MLNNLLEVLIWMRDECRSRPEGPKACIGCPYENFCGRDYSVFKDLPQDFTHPLLDDE